jgi:hypothetical protein
MTKKTRTRKAKNVDSKKRSQKIQPRRDLKRTNLRVNQRADHQKMKKKAKAVRTDNIALK